MSKQIILLLFIVLGAIATLYLYILKSNRNVNYKNDERWLFIQTKANNIVGYLNPIFIVIIAAVYIIILFYDIRINITLNRLLIYIMICIGLRNTIELVALKHYDKYI